MSEADHDDEGGTFQVMEDLQEMPLHEQAIVVHGLVRAEREMTSKFRGVTYNRKSKKWQSVINAGGKHIHLGTYENEEDAALAFDKAAVIVRGVKAKLNYPFSNYVNQDGSIIHDENIQGRVNEAQDPNRKLRAKSARMAIEGGGPDHDRTGEQDASLWFTMERIEAALSHEGSNLLVDSLVLPPLDAACKVLGLILTPPLSEWTPESSPFIATWHDNRLSAITPVHSLGDEARKSLLTLMGEIAAAHLARMAPPPEEQLPQGVFGMPDLMQQALDQNPTQFDAATMNIVTDEALKAIYGPLIAAISGGDGSGITQDFSGIDLSIFPPGVLSGLIQQLTSQNGLVSLPEEAAGAERTSNVGGQEPQDMAGPEEAALALNQLRESTVGVKRERGEVGLDAPSSAVKAAKLSHE